MELLSTITNYHYHQVPSCELFTEQEFPIHQHACDGCGKAFECEVENCEVDKQVCEECEIASKKVKASTSRERFRDCLDDQAVIEETKLRVAQEAAFERSQNENDDHEPWGGIVLPGGQKHQRYAPKYSKPVLLRRRVCD